MGEVRNPANRRTANFAFEPMMKPEFTSVKGKDGKYVVSVTNWPVIKVFNDILLVADTALHMFKATLVRRFWPVNMQGKPLPRKVTRINQKALIPEDDTPIGSQEHRVRCPRTLLQRLKDYQSYQTAKCQFVEHEAMFYARYAALAVPSNDDLISGGWWCKDYLDEKTRRIYLRLLNPDSGQGFIRLTNPETGKFI